MFDRSIPTFLSNVKEKAPCATLEAASRATGRAEGCRAVMPTRCTIPFRMPSPFLPFKRPQGASPGGLQNHFLISLLVIGAVVLASAVAGRFVSRGPRTALEGARASLDYQALEREYARLVDADVYDLENHRGLLDAHLAIPKVTHTRRRKIVRDDTGIQERYERYIQSTDPRLRDIGLYGMGYFFAREQQPDRALEFFNKVG